MLIAGNWKMNTDLDQARQLARAVVDEVGAPESVQVAVCPPDVNLTTVAEEISDSPVRLGAQNMHFENSGAYTGETSAKMLKAATCHYVILGHSERRQYFGETDESVRKKVEQALANGIIPIVCVGETLEQRKAGNAPDVVRSQVDAAVDGLAISDPSRLVLAYEPIWAIGTGESASPDQAQEMHAKLKDVLADHFGETVGASIYVLYGGSMKPHNASDLLSKEDVDGGLVGGASLKAADFGEIVNAGERVLVES